MREIEAEQITAAVRQLCMDANRVLPEDLETCIHCAAEEETSPLGKGHSLRSLRQHGRCTGIANSRLPGHRYGRNLCGGRPGCPYPWEF